MKEDFVKNSIIKYLSRKEWGTNLQFGALHDRGVDIKVRHVWVYSNGAFNARFSFSVIFISTRFITLRN